MMTDEMKRDITCRRKKNKDPTNANIEQTNKLGTKI